MQVTRWVRNSAPSRLARKARAGQFVAAEALQGKRNQFSMRELDSTCPPTASSSTIGVRQAFGRPLTQTPAQSRPGGS